MKLFIQSRKTKIFKRRRTDKLKCLFAVILVLFAVCIVPQRYANAATDSSDACENYEDVIDSLIDSLDFGAAEELYSGFADEVTNPTSFKSEVLNLIRGGENRNFGDILSCFGTLFAGNVKELLPTMLIVLVVAIISGIFSSLDLNTKGVKDAVFLACYAVGSSIVFAETAKLAAKSLSFISDICGAMQSVYPLFATVSCLCGENNKVKILTPICAFITQGVNISVERVLIPAVLGICALSSVAALSERSSVALTRDSIIDVFKWVIGLAVSLLSVFTAVSGVGGAARDGISLRTLKYTVGNTVPIIGGFAKEGVEVVVLAAQVIKSGVGAVFLSVLAVIFASMVIRLLCYSLMLSALNTLCSSFAERRYCDMIVGYKKTVSLIVVVFVAVTILFFTTCYTLLFLQVGM